MSLSFKIYPCHFAASCSVRVKLLTVNARATDNLLRPGVSNLSAMAGRIDFILGVAGHYAIPAAVTAMFECEL